MRSWFGIRRWGVSTLSVGIIAVSLAAVGESAVLRAPSPSPSPSAGQAAVVPIPQPTRAPIFIPERITLPTLRVEAPIVPVGVDADGAMGTPDNGVDVAWWHGRKIGEDNALLAGHKDWKKRLGSFHGLQSLKPGDPVVLTGEGKQLEFKVLWVRQVDADADGTDILGDVGHPAITLITCGGVFDRRVRHYQDRVVVRAVLE